jgi:hypothetical protein
VHLRRALLLFAIVLGLAAVAASVSRDDDGSSENAERSAAPPSGQTGQDPTLAPGSASEAAADLTFVAERAQTRRLAEDRPATILVEVDEPGQVEIPELGLNGTADPLTPARFELLVSDPGRYEIDFTPADSDEISDAGTLVVEAEE